MPVETDRQGRRHWLIVAVRHRKDVYDQLQVAVNRINGELEFVDLAVIGDSSLRRAGITLTSAEPEDVTPTPPTPPAVEEPAPDLPPLLAAYTAEQLRDLGVADQLVDLALTVTTDTELDRLLRCAPTVHGCPLRPCRRDERRRGSRGGDSPVKLPTAPDLADIPTALSRTKHLLDRRRRPSPARRGQLPQLETLPTPNTSRHRRRNYTGPARVSGGPGTGKTVVALHRVKHFAEQIPETDGGRILLTTFTANLAADLRLARYSTL
jgi:hypothetical protein